MSKYDAAQKARIYKRRETHKEEHKLGVRVVHHARREKAIKVLGGGCEQQSDECYGRLEFHHRKGDGAQDPLRKQGSHAIALQIVTMGTAAALKKYACLCSRHHGRADKLII